MARKTYKGPCNDKERSMGKLVEAVGKVICEDGYVGLTASNIAKKAGVNRRLIYLYFDSLDHLIEIYVKGKDYWVDARGSASELIRNYKGSDTRHTLEAMLNTQLDYFAENEEMQKIILWQISKRSKVMFDIAEQREELGKAFFNLADADFKDKNTDLRAVSALLVAGIYYLVLHAKSNDSLFCGIDINSQSGVVRIKKAIHDLLEKTYETI